MKILQRYITSHLLWFTLVALAVLVAVFAFFSLIDQLGDTGRGAYGVPQALAYVVLTCPRLAYELLPIAAMIGAMTALGLLAHTKELAVMRAAGLSTIALSALLARAALLLALPGLIIGELLGPYGEQAAQRRRAMAMNEQIIMPARHSFWARDGRSFINIRQVLPNDEVRDIYIYEFDERSRLRNSIYSPRAEYIDGSWVLHDIRQSVIEDERITRKTYNKAAWGSILQPAIVNLIIIKPQHLTLWGLYDYVKYLRLNAQDAVRYEQALYAKLVKPVTIIAMIILAIPLVGGVARGKARLPALGRQAPRRQTTEKQAIGQQVFTGALLGVSFHFINLACGSLGIVYQLPPLLMACLPTLVLLFVIQHLLRDY